MTDKYKVIYADPPWMYGSKQYQDGGRDFKPLSDFYDSLSVTDIANMPVSDVTSCDCALFIWVVDSHLEEGINVIHRWGFQYKTVAFVWVKTYRNGSTCVNFAPYTLKSTELCLLGIKGSMGKYKVANNIRQLIIAERAGHSRKPTEARTRIGSLFGDVPRLELFARERVQGWDAMGYDIDGKDIRVALVEKIVELEGDGC